MCVLSEPRHSFSMVLHKLYIYIIFYEIISICIYIRIFDKSIKYLMIYIFKNDLICTSRAGTGGLVFISLAFIFPVQGIIYYSIHNIIQASSCQCYDKVDILYDNISSSPQLILLNIM